MVRVSIHRQASLVNDRGLLFLEVDQIKKGKLIIGKVLTFDLTKGRHQIRIKDVLGFTSNTFYINDQETNDLQLIVSNASSVVYVLMLLVLTSLALCFTHHQETIFILWLVFCIYICLFKRHQLYKIKRREE